MHGRTRYWDELVRDKYVDLDLLDDGPLKAALMNWKELDDKAQRAMKPVSKELDKYGYSAG